MGYHVVISYLVDFKAALTSVDEEMKVPLNYLDELLEVKLNDEGQDEEEVKKIQESINLLLEKGAKRTWKYVC